MFSVRLFHKLILMFHSGKSIAIRFAEQISHKHLLTH